LADGNIDPEGEEDLHIGNLGIGRKRKFQRRTVRNQEKGNDGSVAGQVTGILKNRKQKKRVPRDVEEGGGGHSVIYYIRLET